MLGACYTFNEEKLRRKTNITRRTMQKVKIGTAFLVSGSDSRITLYAFKLLRQSLAFEQAITEAGLTRAGWSIGSDVLGVGAVIASIDDLAPFAEEVMQAKAEACMVVGENDQERIMGIDGVVTHIFPNIAPTTMTVRVRSGRNADAYALAQEARGKIMRAILAQGFVCVNVEDIDDSAGRGVASFRVVASPAYSQDELEEFMREALQS
jgi:hypothetical protein